ncbi:MAG TPA: shikimate dehydrogenase [Desulfobacterales bacterium]|nr:shikimate dehydrogenase [Desulfobacterales bacterium]
MRVIDSQTKLYGVIGHPLTHTLSPTIHNAAFEATHLNAVYLAFDTLFLEKALHGLAAIGCQGLSVTIPYKEPIIDYVSDIDPTAKKIGAVNTLVNKSGSWIGYNTDATGALHAIEELCEVSGRHCTILGAGGAARAIGFALREKGCHISVVNRSRPRGEKLAQELDAEYLPLNKLAMINTDIVVQTTPVGMYPKVNDVPFDPAKVRAQIVMDIIYNPFETRFLRQCKEQGATTIPGARMFLHQAAEQFRLWTGKEPPMEVMEKALLQSLRKGHLAR